MVPNWRSGRVFRQIGVDQVKPVNDMEKNYDCTYCGMRASCLDHVLPFSYSSPIDERTRSSYSKSDCVPACKECNGLLSNLMYITVADRAMYLVGRLTEKNKKLLDSPDWSEEDYEELSGRLLEHVKSLQTKKKILKARIDYAKSVSQMADLSPLGVWASQDS